MNESNLGRFRKFANVATVVIVVFAVVQPFVASQTTETLPSGFGQAVIMVRRAESAGANSRELSRLVTLLNKALELDREAINLNPQNESGKRAELLTQVDGILATVQTNASELTLLASERTYTDRVLAYVGAAVAAAIGTIICAFALAFHRKSRIKRTLKMRISRK